MASIERLEALGLLFPELVNTRRIDRFDELVTRDYINHNPNVEQGLAGVQAFFEHFLSAVPDLKMSTEAVFATSDGLHTIGRYSYVGTHQGVFFGWPGTGQPFAMRSIDIWRVEDDRFAEHWDELNTLDIFIQIGAAQMQQPAAA